MSKLVITAETSSLDFAPDYSKPEAIHCEEQPKIIGNLEMQRKTEQVANKILEATKELKLSPGIKPAGTAAAASYMASLITGEKKTQREIAEIAKVSEATVRNRYRELKKRIYCVITL